MFLYILYLIGFMMSGKLPQHPVVIGEVLHED